MLYKSYMTIDSYFKFTVTKNLKQKAVGAKS